MRVARNVIRRCDGCNNDFISRNSLQKCCSTECGKKYRHIKYIDENKNGRFSIFIRDNFKCIYCGKSSIEDGIKLQIDHIIPRSKGGKNDIWNLVTICEECNNQKNAIIFSEEEIKRLIETANKRNNRIDKIDYSNLKKYMKDKYPECE